MPPATPPISPPATPPATPPVALVLNGPNLNLLGLRQPEVYGTATLADVERACMGLGAELGLNVRFRQSNAEGALLDAIHAARDDVAGIVINAGALTHTSIALYDALCAYDGPVIEVHISNVHRREAFRHHSHLSARADGIIVGCGTEGYLLALRRIATLLAR